MWFRYIGFIREMNAWKQKQARLHFNSERKRLHDNSPAVGK